MRTDPLICAHAEYSALASDPERRHSAYRGLFDQDLDSSLLHAIRDATNGDYPLGSEGFKALLFASLGRRTARQKAGRRAKSPAGVYAVG